MAYSTTCVGRPVKTRGSSEREVVSLLEPQDDADSIGAEVLRWRQSRVDDDGGMLTRRARWRPLSEEKVLGVWQ